MVGVERIKPRLGIKVARNETTETIATKQENSHTGGRSITYVINFTVLKCCDERLKFSNRSSFYLASLHYGREHARLERRKMVFKTKQIWTTNGYFWDSFGRCMAVNFQGHGPFLLRQELRKRLSTTREQKSILRWYHGGNAPQILIIDSQSFPTGQLDSRKHHNFFCKITTQKSLKEKFFFHKAMVQAEGEITSLSGKPTVAILQHTDGEIDISELVEN